MHRRVLVAIAFLSILQPHDDLAKVLAVDHVLVRVFEVVKVKDFVDDRLHA